MFLDNKYTQLYFKIIQKHGHNTRIEKYMECHHIVPRSLHGSEDPSNKVFLPARVHYLAHLLLLKMTTGVEKRSMLYAIVRFAGKNINNRRKYKMTSRQYAMIRKIYITNMSGENNPFYGRHHSDETKKKISEANKRYIELHGNPNKGGTISEEHRQKISKANSGKRHLHTEETKRKISEGNKGKVMSPEARQKMKDAWNTKRSRTFTDEHRQKMSIAAKNRQPMSDETKKKLSEALKGKKKSEEAIKNMSIAQLKRRNHEKSN